MSILGIGVQCLPRLIETSRHGSEKIITLFVNKKMESLMMMARSDWLTYFQQPVMIMCNVGLMVMFCDVPTLNITTMTHQYTGINTEQRINVKLTRGPSYEY